ncbi:MAG: hypothetical protein ACPGJE_10540 [Wenzhouxiangellaceae bacterium]
MTRDHERLIELLMILMVAVLLMFARPDFEPETGLKPSSSPALWLVTHLPCAIQSGEFRLPTLVSKRRPEKF